MYPTIQSTGAYKRERNNPVAEMVSREGLFLPSSVILTDEQIDYICDKIIRFMKG